MSSAKIRLSRLRSSCGPSVPVSWVRSFHEAETPTSVPAGRKPSASGIDALRSAVARTLTSTSSRSPALLGPVGLAVTSWSKSWRRRMSCWASPACLRPIDSMCPVPGAEQSAGAALLHTARCPLRRTWKKPALAVKSTAVSIGKSAVSSGLPVRTSTRSAPSGSEVTLVLNAPVVWRNGQASVLPSKPMHAAPVRASCRSSTSVRSAANDGLTVAKVWAEFARRMPRRGPPATGWSRQPVAEGDGAELRLGTDDDERRSGRGLPTDPGSRQRQRVLRVRGDLTGGRAGHDAHAGPLVRLPRLGAVVEREARGGIRRRGPGGAGAAGVHGDPGARRGLDHAACGRRACSSSGPTRGRRGRCPPP